MPTEPIMPMAIKMDQDVPAESSTLYNGNELEAKSSLSITDDLADHSRVILDTNGNDFIFASDDGEFDGSEASENSLLFHSGEENSDPGMEFWNNATHPVDLAENASIMPGAGKDSLYLEEYADIVGSAITGGNTSDFSALTDFGTGVFDVIDHSYTSADGSDIAPLLSGINSDNACPNKGDSDDHVDFSGSDWSLTGDTVTADSLMSNAHDNSFNEYTLVQQIISVTAG